MPGGDGTGPLGTGQMTGRRAGFCAGYDAPGYSNPAPGRSYHGYQRGLGCRGGGRGWRNRYYATGIQGWARAARGWPAWGSAAPYYAPAELAPEQEAEALKMEREYLKKELEDIQMKIRSLEQEPGKEKHI